MKNKRNRGLILSSFLGLALSALTAQAQTNFYWTNIANGGWGTLANWTNGAPVAGGGTNYVLNFLRAATTVTTTNTLGIGGTTNGFLLNSLNVSNVAMTLYGSNLVFVTGGAGGILPTFNQNGASSAVFNVGLLLSNDTTFGGSGSGTVTLNRNITGTGKLIMSGPYILNLTTSNAYSGGTLISQGTIAVTTNNTLGTGNVTITNGGALDISGSTVAQALNFGALVFTISGTGVTNSGALVNNGVSQYNAFQKIVLAGDASVGGSQRLDVRGGVATLDLASNTLTKVGAGTFGVTSGYVSDGNIVVSNGFLRFESTTVCTGTVGAITIHPAGTFQIYTMTNANKLTRPIVLNGGTISFVNNNATRIDSPITLTANSILGGTTIGTIYGAISESNGMFSITKTDASTVNLAGVNTYTGGTIINAGNLQFNTLVSVPTSGLITINAGGALNATGAYTPDAWLASGRIATNSAGTLGLTAYNNATLDFASSNFANLYLGAVGTVTNDGPIIPANNTYRLGGSGGMLVLTNDLALTGNNALVITDPANPGSVTLTGRNNFNGGTTINGTGVLNMNNNDALGTGALFINVNATGGLLVGPNVTVTNTVIVNVNASNGTYSMVASNNTFFTGPMILTNPAAANVAVRISVANGATSTINGVISGNIGGSTSAKLLINRATTGTLVLATNNTYSAYNTLLYGGTLQLGVDGALPVLPVEMQSNSLCAFDLAGHIQTIGTLYSSGGLGAQVVTNSGTGPATLIITPSTAANNFAGKITDGIAGGTIALVISNATQFLSGTNNPYSGGTTLTNGGMLFVGSTNSLGSGVLTSDTTSGIGPTYAVDQPFVDWVANKASTAPGVILLGSNSANNLSFGGALTNTFLGAAAGAFTYNGNATWVDNNVRLGGGSSNLIYASVIGVGTNLIVGPVGGNPASIVTFVSNNTYGTTLINTGTLQIGNAGDSGTLGTGDVTNNSSLAFSRTNTMLVANNISGNGSLKQIGSGMTVLSGTNTYYNGTTLSAGTLSIGDYTNLPATGPVTFSGGTLQITGTTIANLNPYMINWTNFNGGLDIANVANTLTVTNNISGAGTLTKTGAGILTLSGANTYTGVTTVNGGILAVTGTLSNGVGTTSIGSAAGTKGMLYVPTGGSYATTSFANGNNTNGVGSIVINGGIVATTVAATNTGLVLGGGGYGGLFISGGSFTTHRLENNSTATSSVSVIQISGGTLISDEYIIFRNNRFEFTVTGGNVIHSGAGNNIALGYQNAGIGAMTVAGGTVDNTGKVVSFGQAAGTITASLNLNAGTLITDAITSGNGAVSYVNFNGGTLKASAASTTFLPTGVTAAYVNGAFGTFAGGAVVDSNGKDLTFAAALLAPTGNGVSGLTLGSAGSGYIGAPYVEITGGGGSNATGYAVVDLDPTSPTFGQLKGVVLSNPGVGYTNTPTINLLGGGGSGAGVTAAGIVANTSGGLTKLGGGTLTLSGTNTYGGNTLIQAGTLSIASTNALPGWNMAGNITVSNAAMLAVGNAVNDGNVTTILGMGTFAAGAYLGFDTTSGPRTNSMVLANTPAGALGIAKLGANTLMLTNANTYTGPTLINAGTLQISAGGNLGDGGNVTNNGTLLFSRSDSFNINNLISGTGTNRITSGGTLNFTGSGGFNNTGALILGDTNSSGNFSFISSGSSSHQIGSLSVTSTNSSLTNIITIGSGQTLALNGGMTVGLSTTNAHAANLVMTGGGALVVTNSSANVVIGVGQASQNNSDIGWVNMSGLSSVTLGSTNTPINALRIGQGTTASGYLFLSNTSNTIAAVSLALQHSAGGNNGPSGGNLILGAGVNILAVDVMTNGASKGSSTLKFASQDPGSPGTVVIQGLTRPATDIFIGLRNGTGSGTPMNNLLDLRGHVATVTAGNLQMAIENNTQASVITNMSALYFDSGSFTVSNITMAAKSSSGITIASATLMVGGGEFTLNPNGGSGSFSLASQVGGGSANGTLTLSGGVFRSYAPITVGASNCTSTINLYGGTLDMMGTNIGSAAAPITAFNLQSGTLQNLGQFNGGAALVKATSGTLTLAGVNAYSGDTIPNAGTLVIGSTLAMTNSTLNYTNAGGMVSFIAGTTNFILGGLEGSQNISLTNASGDAIALTVGGNKSNTIYTGVLSQGGSLTKTGAGTLELTASNTFTGSVLINGGTLMLDQGAQASLSSASSITVTNNSQLTFDGANTSYTNNAPLTLSGTGSGGTAHPQQALLASGNNVKLIQNGNITLAGTNASDLVGIGGFASTSYIYLNGAIGGTGSLRLRANGANSTHNGYFFLNTNDTYNGDTFFDPSGAANAIVTLGVDNALPSTTVLTLMQRAAGSQTNYSQLILNGHNQTLAGLTSVANVGWIVTNRITGGNATLSTLTISNTVDYAYIGVLGGTTANDNNLALVKSGIGMLTLSNANTYTGTTTISGGTLKMGINAALPSATTLKADDLGATLDLNGYAQQVSGLGGVLGTGFDGAITDSTGGGTLTVNFANTQNFLGSVTGASTLTLTGGGTLIATEVSSFSASVTNNVQGGSTLILNGQHSGVINTLAASTNGGSGAISTLNVLSGGVYMPGATLGWGKQAVTNLTLNPDGLLAVGLAAASNGCAQVTGTFAMTNALLRLDLSQYSFVANQTFVVVDYTNSTGFTYTEGSRWFILKDYGTGALPDQQLTNNMPFSVVGGNTVTNIFTINYDDLANGGHAITLTAVPEPGTASLLGLIGVAFLVRRIRRHGKV